MANQSTLNKMKELMVIVTRERIEEWLDWSLEGVVPPLFQVEPTQAESRYTKGALAQKACSYTNGHYSLSIWSVENQNDRDISIQAEDFLDPQEVGRLRNNKLQARGKNKLVVVRKKGVEQSVGEEGKSTRSY